MNPLKHWMGKASREERELLAELSGTSMGHLNQIAGGYRTQGRASVRARQARRLELAVKTINRRNKALPQVLRTDLSQDCTECEFAQKCLGIKAPETGFYAIPDELHES